MKGSSQEYSLIMALWRGESVTGMNISLPALWSAAIRSITDGTDELFPKSLGTLQAVLPNYLSLCAHLHA